MLYPTDAWPPIEPLTDSLHRLTCVATLRPRQLPSADPQPDEGWSPRLKAAQGQDIHKLSEAARTNSADINSPARGGAPRPHARAYLRPYRALRGFDPRRCGCGESGRGLSGAGGRTTDSTATATIRISVHFIVTSACSKAGDLGLAVAQSRKLMQIVPGAKAVELGRVQAVVAAPSFAFAQGGSPAQILALPRPDARLPYVRAMWHYARGVAFARLERPGAAGRWQLAAMELLVADPDQSAGGTGGAGHGPYPAAGAARRCAAGWPLRAETMRRRLRHTRKAQAIEGPDPLSGAARLVRPGGSVAGRGAAGGGRRPDAVRGVFVRRCGAACRTGQRLGTAGPCEKRTGAGPRP